MMFPKAIPSRPDDVDGDDDGNDDDGNDRDDNDDDDNNNDNDNDDDDNGIPTLAQLLWHWQWMVFVISGPELFFVIERKNKKDSNNPIRHG